MISKKGLHLEFVFDFLIFVAKNYYCFTSALLHPGHIDDSRGQHLDCTGQTMYLCK